MKKIKTYRIVGETNLWIARRDKEFGGKCEVVLAEGLEYLQACRKLLGLYNRKYDGERNVAVNWSVAVAQSKAAGHGARPTNGKRGLRSFEYDSRFYRMELED